MSESDELFTTVHYIKNKVEALEKLSMLNLRSNVQLRDQYTSELKKDSLLLRIYKSIDGVRSQNDIASLVDTTPKTVSVKIKKLHDLHLIEIKEITSNTEKIYKHTIVEQIFRLSKISYEQ